MGGECSNLCNVVDNEKAFVRESGLESKNYQLPINFKTSRAIPE